MTHQITIPDEMWDWAERQCRARGEGPASFMRAVLIGAMLNGGVQVHQETPPWIAKSPTSEKAKRAIIDVLEGSKIYAHACTAILESNWNYIDPAGKMNKDPEQVEDFLSCCKYEVGMYADMFATRRNLLKMIFDAYMRAHGGWSE